MMLYNNNDDLIMPPQGRPFMLAATENAAMGYSLLAVCVGLPRLAHGGVGGAAVGGVAGLLGLIGVGGHHVATTVAA